MHNLLRYPYLISVFVMIRGSSTSVRSGEYDNDLEISTRIFVPLVWWMFLTQTIYSIIFFFNLSCVKLVFVMLSLAGNLPKLLFLGRYNETRHMSMESSNIFRHTMLCLISEMHFVYSYTFSLHLRQKYVLSILSIWIFFVL